MICDFLNKREKYLQHNLPNLYYILISKTFCPLSCYLLPHDFALERFFLPLYLLHTSISCYTPFHSLFFPTQQKPCTNSSIRPVSEVLWNVTLTLRVHSKGWFPASVRSVLYLFYFSLFWKCHRTSYFPRSSIHVNYLLQSHKAFWFSTIWHRGGMAAWVDVYHLWCGEVSTLLERGQIISDFNICIFLSRINYKMFWSLWSCIWSRVSQQRQKYHCFEQLELFNSLVSDTLFWPSSSSILADTGYLF